MQKYLIWGVVMLLANVLSAQETKEKIPGNKSRIGISVGLLQGYLGDDNFSVLNHTELGLLYGLKYIRQKGASKNKFQAQVFYSGGKVKTAASDSLTSDYIIGNVELTWLRKMKNANERRVFYLGGGYNFNFNYFDYLYQSTFSFLAAHSLRLKGELDYVINEKHGFNVALSIPLVTSIVRPPFTGKDFDVIEKNTFQLIMDGDLTSLNKYFAAHLDVDYQYSLSNRWMLVLNYQFIYQRFANINQFIQAQNQYRVGLNLKF